MQARGTTLLAFATNQRPLHPVPLQKEDLLIREATRIPLQSTRRISSTAFRHSAGITRKLGRRVAGWPSKQKTTAEGCPHGHPSF
jgi:hypothetical protein